MSESFKEACALVEGAYRELEPHGGLIDIRHGFVTISYCDRAGNIERMSGKDLFAAFSAVFTERSVYMPAMRQVNPWARVLALLGRKFDTEEQMIRWLGSELLAGMRPIDLMMRGRIQDVVAYLEQLRAG